MHCVFHRTKDTQYGYLKVTADKNGQPVFSRTSDLAEAYVHDLTQGMHDVLAEQIKLHTIVLVNVERVVTPRIDTPADTVKPVTAIVDEQPL